MAERKGRKIVLETIRVEMPEGAEIGNFAPVAYFDKHMDCLRVMTMDRSVTEERVNGSITLHRCNHRSTTDPEYVGFTIKGVRHLFDEVGIDLDGVYLLADIVDRLVKYRPGTAMSSVLKLIYRDIDVSGDLKVDLAA